MKAVILNRFDTKLVSQLMKKDITQRSRARYHRYKKNLPTETCFTLSISSTISVRSMNLASCFHSCSSRVSYKLVKKL